MKKIALYIFVAAALFISTSASARGGCELAQVGDVEVTWTGYKTDEKVGVSGGFNGVKYIAVAPSGENFRSILVGSKVLIDTQSVNSKHQERDAKLAKFFFGMMSKNSIEAKIVDMKPHKGEKSDKKAKKRARTGELSVEIEMNGVKKVVPMSYSFNDDVFEAKGVIDMLDFGASNALSSINKACFDLHKGKTWSEVGISFKTKIEAKLCNAEPLKMTK